MCEGSTRVLNLSMVMLWRLEIGSMQGIPRGSIGARGARCEPPAADLGLVDAGTCR
jgi:hypothetical protein